MNIKKIVDNKLNARILSSDEILFVVDNYTKGKINDNDMTSFLKAVCANGMNDDETINLTNAMLSSGSTLDLNSVSGVKADKHSTGGVGDKTTLIVGAIVASTGINVAKMSGRALGFTGGTIDKLESIPGFRVNLSKDEFIEQLKKIQIALTSQTDDLVKADKKMYALRDITNTVSSIPLIASSIMSKKLATGADVIVLDVKVGDGALVTSIEEARDLSKLMIKIGKSFNKKMVAIISSMNEPLGYNIGNSLEIEEVMDVLKGEGETNLELLCKELAVYMVILARDITYAEAIVDVEEALNSGSAYHKFLELIKAQGGDITSIPKSKYKTVITSSENGYVKDVNAKMLGEYVMSLGAGRKTKEDVIDYSVGIKILKKIGDKVSIGDRLLEISSNTTVSDISMLKGFLLLDSDPRPKENIIIEIIRER